MSSSPELESHVAAQYRYRRWRRFGHDRLYVSMEGDAETRQLGYRDLATGLDHPEGGGDATLLGGAADRWGGGDHVTAAPEEPAAGAAEPAPAPWRDLSHNLPGESAQTQAVARRTQAPVKSALGRLLGVHTPERAWRVGAKGERLVAEQLSRLAERDPRWTALHAVPVGNRGADIDHLVIGPGGVFSVNTKHHRDADIWVGGDTFIVNGSRVPYIRHARHEAERATRLLTAALGRPVPVTGLIVPVACKAPVTIKSQPRGVYVVTRRDLVAWLSSLGQVWSEPELTAIWESARRSTTWSA